jgi:uncharacterized protein
LHFKAKFRKCSPDRGVAIQRAGEGSVDKVGLPHLGDTIFRNEHEFSRILKENIRPARPIDSPELLQGRASVLKDIRRALSSPGMHVFIHGERGVGKTSLAITAAKAHVGREAPYIGCDDRSTFLGIVRDICHALLGTSLLHRDNQITGSAGINVGLFKAEANIGGTGRIKLPDQIESTNQAVNLIRECAINAGAIESLVIIDEIDRAESPDLKSQFAELIKRIHDTRAPIRFIMCGIGKTLDEIIGSHLSAGRAISAIELAPISFDARWTIVNNAASKLSLSVDKEYNVRISQISDGFPYYVHLIAESLFWEMFDQKLKQATSDSFHAAVRRSIERAEAPLRDAYNFAIQKTKNSVDYEETLWSVAESTHLERQIKEIYAKSYRRIMENRRGRTMLPPDKFRMRLYSLCDERHGTILVRKRNSWYAFKENVERGYVRLVAQRHGVELGNDHF